MSAHSQARDRALTGPRVRTLSPESARSQIGKYAGAFRKTKKGNYNYTKSHLGK